MTVKEKLQLYVNNGGAASHIAKIIGVDASTLNKWLKDQKGITHKNEALVKEALKEIGNNLKVLMEEK